MQAFTNYAYEYAITTSDTVDIGQGVTWAISVGGAGNMVAVLQDGKTVTMAVQAGQIVPLRVRRINATSTTATGLVGLYENPSFTPGV